MKNSLLKKASVKVSPESAISLRLSRLESLLERVLMAVEGPTYRRQVPPCCPDINSDIVQDAIRAHIKGDRGPMIALERMWESQQTFQKLSFSNTVGTSTGVDKKSIPNEAINV